MTGDDNDDDTTPPGERALTDGERRRHFEVYPPRTAVVRELPAAPRNQFEQNLHERLASLEASRRFWRWVAGLGVPVLLTVAFTLLLYGADKLSASSERAGEVKAQIKALEEEVRFLLKMSGIDPKAVSIARSDAVPSFSCGAGCTVSQDCSDVFSQCRYCYLGRCSSTLPAQPTTSDAGIDAPPTNQKGTYHDLVSNP